MLALVAMFAAACGDDEDEPSTSAAAPPASSTAAAPETTAAEPTSEAAPEETAATEETAAPEETAASSEATEATSAESTEGGAEVQPIKVGLVTDVGGLNDKGFNQLANEGLQRAASELGSTVEVRESKAPTDYVPNLTFFAQQKYDLVVAVGFLMGADLGKVAAQFPDTKFAIVDFSASDEAIAGAPNVLGLLFKEQEAGYLVGYLAGALHKAGGFKGLNDKNTISTVGGIKIPPVDRYIAGFQAGAEAANPGMTFLNGYSNDFVDQAKCKELAADQISKGSDIVFQVAGNCGLGALEAAGEANVWGVGVDKEQSQEGPHVLTSALKKVDEAVFTAIKSAADGTFTGGTDLNLGVAEDAVGLGVVSPDVPQEILDEVDAQVEAIKGGSVTIPTEVP